MADPSFDSMLEELVGLHVIDGLHEEWERIPAYHHLHDPDDDDDDDEDDEDDGDHDGEHDDEEEALVLYVSVDGEMHALFDRGTPRHPRLAASRQGSEAWPFHPGGDYLHRDAAAIRHDVDGAPSRRVVCNLLWRPDSDLPLFPGSAAGDPDRVLVAVDEQTGLIVLEVGVERYEYLAPSRVSRLVMPMSTVERILRGAPVTVPCRADAPFRPSRIIIGRNPDDWIVEDILIGGESQIVRQQADPGIPGGVFSADSTDAILLMGTVDLSRGLEVVVSYVGGDPLGETLLAAVLGDSLDPGEPIVLVGSRFILRWTPEGRSEPWMATRQG